MGLLLGGSCNIEQIRTILFVGRCHGGPRLPGGWCCTQTAARKCANDRSELPRLITLSVESKVYRNAGAKSASTIHVRRLQVVWVCLLCSSLDSTVPLTCDVTAHTGGDAHRGDLGDSQVDSQVSVGFGTPSAIDPPSSSRITYLPSNHSIDRLFIPL